MDLHPISFGGELRRRRIDAGMSLATLAKLIHYSKSHLSKIETGVKRPNLDLARQCDALLHGDGALVGIVAASMAVSPAPVVDDPGEVWVMSLTADGQSDFGVVSRREVLAAGLAGLASWSVLPPRPGVNGDEATLAAFRSMFDHVRSLGQQMSPVALLPMLVTQTHALRTMAPHCRPAIRDGALVLAARFAEFAGWMAQEAGDDARALWWTDRAVELAAAGGDQELEALALVRRALVALYRHDPVETLALAQQAQALRRSARIRGLAAQREAQGHAMAGDYDQCFRALERAAGLLDEASA